MNVIRLIRPYIFLYIIIFSPSRTENMIDTIYIVLGTHILHPLSQSSQVFKTAYLHLSAFSDFNFYIF